MPKRAECVELALKIRTRSEQASDFSAELSAFAPHADQIRPHQGGEHVGMADKQCRKIRARRKQAEQDAASRRMLLEQSKKRSARTNRGDKLGEIHKREVGLGKARDV